MGLKDRMCWPVPILTWGIWGQSSDGGDDGETTQFEGRQGVLVHGYKVRIPHLAPRMSWSRAASQTWSDRRTGRQRVVV